MGQHDVAQEKLNLNAAFHTGAHVAEVLAKGLPKNHRVILVDKNR